MDLTGKIAFVTGASGGLGRAIAEALAAAGAHVAIGYHQGKDRAEETAAAVALHGVKAELVSFDQADAASIAASVPEVVEKMGSLDILINNAAVAKGVPFPDLDALTP